MKTFTTTILLASLLATANLGKAEEAPPSGQEILERLDKLRNPTKPYRVQVVLREYAGGKLKDSAGYVSITKPDAQVKQITIKTSPPRDAGRKLLILGGRVWYYDNASKATVALSPQQRLLGRASIADIMNIMYSLDYEAKLLGVETIADSDRNPHKAWHLDLKAKRDSAPYARIEAWIEPGTYYLLKGKFFSDSGRMLKVAYYKRYEATQLGIKKSMESVILDEVSTKMITTLTFSDWRPAELPDAWLQKAYLPQITAE